MTGDRKDAPRTDSVPGMGPLLAARRFFTQAEISADGRSLHESDPAEWDRFYRDRWAHDKVVRSTHGVNCTGSCSWQVFVKDGLITWEHQATDYPSVGPDSPEYEPRGCPQIRPTTTRMDKALFAVLAVTVVLGMAETVGRNLLGGGYDYRDSVAVWFRGIFGLHPDSALMAHAPLVYQLHALSALVFIALWPFTRLVHVWSAPVAYLWRPYIVYRRRAGRPRRFPRRAATGLGRHA